jgi:IS5 family transposase
VRARARARTDTFRRSHLLRLRVEHFFGTIKYDDGFRRVRRREMRGSTEQFLMGAMARNLKRMARLGVEQVGSPVGMAI